MGEDCLLADGMRMTRWWPVGVALLLVGGAVTVAVMRPQVDLPAGHIPVMSTDDPVTSTLPALTYDLRTRLPRDEGLYALQWLADGVRCPVTDNISLMASCVLQRYGKMRDKALSARARYEALIGLERAYWASLAREGLTQRIEHVPAR